MRETSKYKHNIAKEDESSVIVISLHIAEPNKNQEENKSFLE